MQFTHSLCVKFLAQKIGRVYFLTNLKSDRYVTQTQREWTVRGSNVKDTNDAAIKVLKFDTLTG